MITNQKLMKISKYSAVIISFIAIGFAFGVNHGRGIAADNLSGVDMGEFWKVWNHVHETFVDKDDIDNEILVYGAIQGMVEALDDPYTNFLTPEEKKSFDEEVGGNFEGVGMEVGSVDGLLTVVAPLKNTPAEKAGIKSGDIIIAIDGESYIGSSIDEAILKIRGEKGTMVTITIKREGVDDLLDIEIIRDTIKIPVLETRIEKDIYIIELYSFIGSVDKDFREAISKFKVSPLNKLILDLRGNPGGYLESAIEISSYFLPEGKIIVQEDFGDEKRVARSSGEIFKKGEIEMVILIDSGSASASEIVAGALSEHGVATTIGSKTFGKGSVQKLIDVTNNTSLKITIAKWLTPEGKTISGEGLEPDIDVEFLQEHIDGEIDPQLQEAIKFLNK